MPDTINSGYNFSFFSSLFQTRPESNCDINQLCELIRHGYYFKQVSRIREVVSDPIKYKKLKETLLPAVTVSGTFSKRAKTGIQKHSGLIQVDFDNVEQIEKTREALEEDQYTYVAFLSPGGNGIKLIVKINPDIKTHEGQFDALQSHYRREYNLELDPSCRDISRLMLLSLDHSIYCNPHSLIFEEIEEPKKSSVAEPAVAYHSSFSDKEALVRSIAEATDNQKIDITDTYDKWFRIGFAISGSLGENGRKYFHSISRHYPNYAPEETDRVFSNLLGCKTQINLGTLVYFARKAELKFELTPLEKSNKSKATKDLHEKIKSWRLKKARKLDVPAFCVFGNRTLEEICAKKPRNLNELSEVYGIGNQKIRQYGDELLALINS